MSVLETLLIIPGMLGLGYFFLALFTSLGDGAGCLKPSRTLKLSEPSFFSALEGAVHETFQTGGHAEIINNGDEFFPALHEAIIKAEKSINIMVFIWMRGPLGDGIFDALIARAKAGVEVRLLLDALGCSMCSGDKVKELREAGGKVVYFRPLKFGIIHRFHRRNHSRAFAFDGLVGFTGGIAIEGRWDGHAQDADHWRDNMVKTTGPMTLGIQKSFSKLWSNVTGEILIGERFFPSLPPEASPKWLSVISSPSFESHPARKVFGISCLAAEKSICIRNPYFVPGPIVSKVLCDQAKAGIDVRILVPDHQNDQKLAYYSGRFYYDELMSAGVKIYEFKRTMLHTKSMLVDDTWSIFGSANIDIRSHELNDESMLGIYDDKLGAKHHEDFENDLRDAEQLSLDTWRQRSMKNHILERLCSVFAQQL